MVLNESVVIVEPYIDLHAVIQGCISVAVDERRLGIVGEKLGCVSVVHRVILGSSMGGNYGYRAPLTLMLSPDGHLTTQRRDQGLVISIIALDVEDVLRMLAILADEPAELVGCGKSQGRFRTCWPCRFSVGGSYLLNTIMPLA